MQTIRNRRHFLQCLGTSALFLLLGCGGPGPAPVQGQKPKVTEADCIAPEDLGMNNYILAVTPKQGEVACFRIELSDGEKVIKTMEQISNSLGAEVSRSVVLVNQGVFDSSRQDKLKLNAKIAVFEIPGNYTEIDMSDDKVVFHFNTTMDLFKKITFSIHTEKYSDAKKRMDKLPDPSKKWAMMGPSTDNSSKP